MKNNPEEDRFLLSAMQGGDRKAFDALFRKYYIPLCTYSRQFVGLEDAKEVVQDVMLWMWENRETQCIEYSFSQYIFKAVYHRSMNVIAHNEAKLRTHAIYSERIMSMLHETDVCQLNELSRRLKEALDELPDSYREAFFMNRFKDMSYKEIAQLLNVSPKTVDYRIQQALKILRIKLKDYLPLFMLLIEFSKGGNWAPPVM